MKKLVIFGTILFSGLVIGNSTISYAEEDVEEVGQGTVVESERLQSSTEVSESAVEQIEKTNESSESLNKEVSSNPYEATGGSLRATFEYYGTSKEFLDTLTDEQLAKAEEVSKNLGGPSFQFTQNLLEKMYGVNPIPEDSYSITYSVMQDNTFEQYLPQLRLTLIHVFDVDEATLGTITDEQLIAIVKRQQELQAEALKQSQPAGSIFANIAAAITDGEYLNIIESEASDGTETTSTETNQSTKQSEEKKKGIFPNTGEKVQGFITILGIGLILAIIGLIFYKKRAINK